MNFGEKLIELELGSKKSIKYKRLYSGIRERISKKLKKSKNELELIKNFLDAKSEFDKYKPKNMSNELFHTSLRKSAFNNYNLFFVMRDCFKEFEINVNLFTENGIYYIKTENYLIFNNKIVEIENHNRNEDFFVLSENLIFVNTYRRLSNLFKLIDMDKSIEYSNTMNNIINSYYGINEILKLNYPKLDNETIDLLSNNEENYEISFLKGDIFMKEKKYRLAEEEYMKVLPIDKAYNDLYFKIGDCLSKQMRYRESLRYYLEILDKDYEILFNIGYAYYKLKNIDKAIEYFTETIMINERCMEAYLNLGLCYMNLSSFDIAKSTIEKGIRILGKRKEFENILKKIKEKEKKHTENFTMIDTEKNIYFTMKEVKA